MSLTAFLQFFFNPSLSFICFLLGIFSSKVYFIWFLLGIFELKKVNFTCFFIWYFWVEKFILPGSSRRRPYSSAGCTLWPFFNSLFVTLLFLLLLSITTFFGRRKHLCKLSLDIYFCRSLFLSSPSHFFQPFSLFYTLLVFKFLTCILPEQNVTLMLTKTSWGN